MSKKNKSPLLHIERARKTCVIELPAGIGELHEIRLKVDGKEVGRYDGKGNSIPVDQWRTGGLLRRPMVHFLTVVAVLVIAGLSLLLSGCAYTYETTDRMPPAAVADKVAECRALGLVDSYDADRHGVITVYCVPVSEACGQAVTP